MNADDLLEGTGRLVDDPRVFWPSDNPRMTPDELAAWLPGAIVAARAAAVERKAEKYRQDVDTVRRVLAMVEARLVEVEAAGPEPVTFVEVECPCCSGCYLVDGDTFGSTTIAEHIAHPDRDPACERAMWGSSAPLRDFIPDMRLTADGGWRIVTG